MIQSSGSLEFTNVMPDYRRAATFLQSSLPLEFVLLYFTLLLIPQASPKSCQTPDYKTTFVLREKLRKGF